MNKRVQITVTPPCADETAAHVAYALSLGLPEADAELIRTLTVIANGPSAIHAPLHGETLALNGAIKLFFNSGRVPTYWAACDPQAIVADFLPDEPPMETIYFVASKCHPSVFEKLRGRDVRLWHIDDYEVPPGLRRVRSAASVTLVALTLMRRLGYRAFELHGWDGCFDGMTHHASEAPAESYPDNVADVVLTHEQPDGSYVPGRAFKTTHPWMAEAQDACLQLHHADYSVTIHGDGLIKAILEAKGIRTMSRS